MDYKIVLGICAIVINFIGFGPYFKNLLAGKTRPHAFSWIIWGILEATAFFAQLSQGGGPGAWVTGASALMVFFIAGVAIYRRDTEIKLVDWLAFGGGILGIVLWYITKNPLTAVILVVISDALAFVPTFRKSYSYPEQETLFEYVCSATKYFISLFALQSVNLTTWLYPFSLIITNVSLVIMSAIRRKTLKQKI